MADPKNRLWWLSPEDFRLLLEEVSKLPPHHGVYTIKNPFGIKKKENDHAIYN